MERVSFTNFGTYNNYYDLQMLKAGPKFRFSMLHNTFINKHEFCFFSNFSALHFLHWHRWKWNRAIFRCRFWFSQFCTRVTLFWIDKIVASFGSSFVHASITKEVNFLKKRFYFSLSCGYVYRLQNFKLMHSFQPKLKLLYLSQ